MLAGDENKLTVASPCVKVCTIKDGSCIGCGRTLDEIARWTRMTSKERKQVNERVSHRIQRKKDSVLPSKQLQRNK